ncbi:hypothetical protein VMCG_00029 [Cytospora schulzeri]|uniref:NADH dehydrogenase [ubiquinone] 1 alpha subcomplex assembly factor 3 n=1 Tax=Cytospora schulzeri TaxID=448051 RepID=A0A423X8F7_9PEZI|nr:hypothetical protein VMCG_00029 [Valsa malicola]
MASTVRQTRALRHLQSACQNLQVTASPRQTRSHSSRHLPGPAACPLLRLLPRPVQASPPSSSHFLIPRCASLHVSSRRPSRRAHNDEEVPDAAPTTDFARMDMLGQTPAPSTSVDMCMSEGFKLNSGASIYDGRGVVLVDGEAFAWQPWGPDMRLLNDKGQWEVKEEAFALLDLLWPRPDLLILGLGGEMRPLSPATRKYLSSLGLRIEVLDTRNAAAHFNMLATERGVDEVAAALIPIGWREGIGANYD